MIKKKKKTTKKVKRVERSCATCKFSGCDPDGPYCCHSKVIIKHPYGLSLSSQTITEFCPSPSLPLWQKG